MAPQAEDNSQKTIPPHAGTSSPISNGKQKAKRVELPNWMLWLIVPLIIVLLNVVDHQRKAEQAQPKPRVVAAAPAKPTQAELTQQKAEADKENLRPITEALEALSAIKPKECADAPDVCLSLLNGFATTLQTAQGNDLPAEGKEQARKLHSQLASLQVKVMPIIRKSYVKLLGQKLWAHDVEVSINDKTLTLVGGVFAANANIQQTQEELYPLLRKLRFTKVYYKWSEAATRFTHYDITEAYPDTAVVAWDEYGNFTEVKGE